MENIRTFVQFREHKLAIHLKNYLTLFSVKDKSPFLIWQFLYFVSC